MCSPSQLQAGPADGSINSSEFVTLIERANDRREIEVDNIEKPLSNWLVRLDSSFGRLILQAGEIKLHLSIVGVSNKLQVPILGHRPTIDLCYMIEINPNNTSRYLKAPISLRKSNSCLNTPYICSNKIEKAMDTFRRPITCYNRHVMTSVDGKPRIAGPGCSGNKRGGRTINYP